jgi:hypothetical protein
MAGSRTMLVRSGRSTTAQQRLGLADLGRLRLGCPQRELSDGLQAILKIDISGGDFQWLS